MSNENAIGQYLKELVNGGRLVKDEVVVWLFKVFLETLDNKYIQGSLIVKCVKIAEKSTQRS